MRFASLDHFRISPWRIGAVGAAAAGGSGLSTELVLGDSVGQARVAIALIVAALVLYIVLSTPRRLLDAQRVSQARESPLLSASASACLAVTGSRPRTLILLRSRDQALADSLRDTGRRVLLGASVEGAVAGSVGALASYSAAASLRALAAFTPKAVAQGDEEMRGIVSSAELSRETKIPMLTTVCFFAPILLILYAVFSRSYGAVQLGELASLEFIAIDLAFYLCAADRGAR